jgi:hypothetical protein
MRPLIVLSLVLLPLVSGCVFGNERIRDEVDTIAWDLRPLELEPETELRIGRSLLGLASTVARWSDDHDAEFVAELLDEVDAVDLGIYTLHGDWREGPDGLTTSGVEELKDLGWRPVVRTREHRDGDRWILYRGDSGHDQMLVVGLEGEELIVLRLEGQLGGILDNAIRREDDLIVVAREVHSDF